MNNMTCVLLLLASASPALGMTTIKAKVIGSDSKLEASSLQGLQNTDAASLEGDAQSAFGGGVDVEFALSEPLRVGAGFGHTAFEDKDGPAFSNFSKTSLNGYGTYDFLTHDIFALYGKAGISYHQVAFENENVGPLTVSIDDTGLLNYDLGVGSRFRLNDNVNFGLEYAFSDTFSRNDADVTLSGLGLADTGSTLKNISVRSNELVASLGYSF